jgi:predicted dienelactone hydrolase
MDRSLSTAIGDVPVKRVLSRLVLACLLLVSTGAATYAADSIGFRNIVLPAGEAGRALDIALWYPTPVDRPQTVQHDNAAFGGFPVVADAPPALGRHPLAVLSHGFGGNWNNQAWLAVELVRQGYVVAAPNHPGTTSRDMNMAVGRELWQRPRDLSRMIDWLTGDPAWAPLLSPDRVAVIGHSLGGWTAIEIAGGRLDAARTTADCAEQAALASCKVYQQLGAGQDPASRAALSRDLRDARVKAVVSLDLGLARSFDPASLTAIDAKVLVVAAGTDTAGIPASLESRYMADQLPAASTRYVEIADAAHFSFMPVCKPGARALIEEETPGDGIVCDDGGGRDRAAIHQQVVGLVTAFLAHSLAAE